MASMDQDLVETGKPLSKDTIAIVVKTWALVEQDPLKHGLVFYKRMFTEYPEVRPLFSFSSTLAGGDNIKDNLDAQAQARKLTHMISYAVGTLDNLSELVPKLKASGATHFIKYHVKPEHFQMVGESLLWTLKEGLGDIYTRDTNEAWIAVYGLMADVMIEGGKEAMAANAN